MLKKLITLGFLAATLSFSSFAHAQAGPTATALSNLQIGGGFTYARTDYGQKGDEGFTVFGDYDLGVHWGVEAAYHYISVRTPDNVSENSFDGGPRFIIRKHHFKLYGKGMIGLGHINVVTGNRTISNETDFLIAGGGGIEYQIGRHVTLRPVDFEYQRWSYLTGLTPAVFTAGVAYRFH